ncbi:MAG: phosphoribosylaminoimidazolesuccinocarboxamide synthase [Patescibacteria group bacterium]
MNQIIREGKTKKIMMADMPEHVIIESKDDITAGDGAKRDVISGKGELANLTTSNVFRFLKACGLPVVAFIKEIDETRFLAERCKMIPLELVVRREAHGSFLHRHPHLQEGDFFPALLFECFAKTNDKIWRKNRSIPMDDPFLDLSDDSVKFYRPHWTDAQKKESEQTGFKGFLVGQKPFLLIPRQDFFPVIGSTEEDFIKMKRIAKQTFLILEKAWQLLGRRLVDFKVECGVNMHGELRLADVIDNDSWRVIDDEKHISKQLYRDGADINEVTAKYRLVAELTGKFGLPRQQIILWRASESDDLTDFKDAFRTYNTRGSDFETCKMRTVTYSLHKEPVLACEAIGKLVQEVPDSVVIVYCGRNNGAGPTLSAQCTVPVITVPATWREFPEDVWSSLRTPSETPVMTVFDPKNAILAALQILAMQNPELYASLRIKQEERFLNFVRI